MLVIHEDFSLTLVLQAEKSSVKTSSTAEGDEKENAHGRSTVLEVTLRNTVSTCEKGEIENKAAAASRKYCDLAVTLCQITSAHRE